MTHAVPDPMQPECAACGRQEPGTTERPVHLVPCSTCGPGVVYCGGECFSTHTPAKTRAAR